MHLRMRLSGYSRMLTQCTRSHRSNDILLELPGAGACPASGKSMTRVVLQPFEPLGAFSC